MGDKLKDKVALVTGAGRGLGKAIALGYAREGADLIVSARSAEQLRDTAKEAEALGRKVMVAPLDVRDREAVNATVRRALDQFERIDILLNGAGIYMLHRFLDYSPEEFDRVIKTNVYGTFHVTQAVLPSMMARRGGKIVNISSTAGKAGSRYQCVYNMSKHAIVGMTRSLALELSPLKINVNAMCPGIFKTDVATQLISGWQDVLNASEGEAIKYLTDIVPLGRWAEPEELVPLAVYLASSESDYMTGESIVLGGGFSMS